MGVAKVLKMCWDEEDIDFGGTCQVCRGTLNPKT